MKGGIGLQRKISAFIATNRTSICCVSEEKMLKKVASAHIPKVATFNLDHKIIKQPI